MSKYIIALDLGTTSCRTVLFNHQFESVDIEQKEFTQYFPEPGWVEHNADEIWEIQQETLEKVLHRNSIKPSDVSAIGISNQRETWVAWDQQTGKCLSRAIVWQDRRGAKRCEALKLQGLEKKIRSKTGLLLDPYFSGTKAEWLLRNNKAVAKAANAGTLAFGTIDSFLISRLTQGLAHVTEPSNASRTLLFNVNTLSWDKDLMKLFGVPLKSLPRIQSSNSLFGTCVLPSLYNVPIHGVLGDQQAALFGHRCFHREDVKNTYGTGCFLLKNIGQKFRKPPRGLLGTVAWTISNRTTYAHEGAVMVGGAVIQFLRDQWGIIANAAESEVLARSLSSNEGVYFVPAFAGLGTPYWDSSARGILLGLTRGTSKAHLCRSALESIAFQSVELCEAFGSNSIKKLHVDGGASENKFLMQFQADVLGKTIEVSDNKEMTALGAALMAGLGGGILNISQIEKLVFPQHRFQPKMSLATRKAFMQGWKKAVKRSKHWV